MKSLNQYISQVKDLHSLNEYIQEQLSDVKTKWHPKKGLFTGDDPKEIVDYLMKNSKDAEQAMQRICFYMNRAGDKLTNKTVLNDAKRLLKKKKLNERLIINKNFSRNVNTNSCLLIFSVVADIDDKASKTVDQTQFIVNKNFIISDDEIIISQKQTNSKQTLKRVDDYYVADIHTSNISINIIGLEYDDAIDFLENIEKDVPTKINVHDYFKSAINNENFLGYYDTDACQYKNYTKEDIEKLIKDLNK